MVLNWADWTIVGIIAFSCLISLVRGFVKEALSLLTWVLAFFVATAFHERLAVLLESRIDSATLRYVLSFAALLVATLLVGALINRLVVELVKVTGLTGADRLFGIAFGLVRGVIVVMALLIFLPMLLPVERDDWWRDSQLIPQLLLIEQWCRDTFGDLLGWLTSLRQ